MAQYSNKQDGVHSVVEETLSVYSTGRTPSAAFFSCAEGKLPTYTMEEICQRLNEADSDYAEGRFVDADIVLAEIDEWLKVV